jgi:pimeloyl-ACP methyl ester carboxylesterase
MGNHRELVLLLHGFFQTRNIWEVMEDRLRFDGYGVMSFNLGGLLWRFNTHPVDRTAAMIAEKIESLRERYDFDRLHIVGHSKGGLIARRYVQHYGGDKRVKSVITLGTPHRGTPTAALGVALMGFGAIRSSAADLLPGSGVVQRLSTDAFPGHIPLTSVYSRQDLVCPHWCSVLRRRPGESHLTNVEISGIGHSQLVWDGAVYRKVREHLDHASAIWSERVSRPHEGRLP